MAIIPLRTVARARVSTSVVHRCFPPAFRSARIIGRKKGRGGGGDTAGRRKQSCTGDIVIWALDSRPRTADYNTGGDKNVGRAGNKNSRETREQRRDRNALARGREGSPVGSRLRSSPREKKLNAALVPEQNMAHVASRGTIGPVGGEQTEQELHSPPRYSYSCPLDTP